MSRLFLMVMAVSACRTPQAAKSFAVPENARSLPGRSCIGCHSGDSAEGDVRFDTLTTLGNDERLELLNRAHEQLYFRLMPPDGAKQPGEKERVSLADWFSRELTKYDASSLEDKLRSPPYGNYVDHDKLFSGEYADTPAFTRDRRWLISEFIFDARFNRILNHKPFQTIDGKRQFVIGDNNRRVNLTNPLLLPTNTGVRYYANTALNGGHLLTMITNAKETAVYMVYLTTRDKRYAPAIADVMSMEWEHEQILASSESFLHNFIDRILQEPEGQGNMFDNTMILYFPENGEGHHSWGTEAPFVIMAGNNCKLDITDRYIRLPYHGAEGHKTIGNWYTTLLNAHGNSIEHYGDFDLEMARKKLDQTGAIRQFMS